LGEDFATEVDVSDLKRMCDEGEMCIEDDDCGCEECGAPGSTLTLTVEKRGENDYRLVSESDIMCSCMSMYGEPESASGGTEHYVPIAKSS